MENNTNKDPEASPSSRPPSTGFQVHDDPHQPPKQQQLPGSTIGLARKSMVSPMAKVPAPLPPTPAMAEAPNNDKLWIIYYCHGDVVIRPVAILKGTIGKEYTTIPSYILRRSHGQIKWILYDPSLKPMLNDYKYLMRMGVAKADVTRVAVQASGTAKVYVYGEYSHGFTWCPTEAGCGPTLNMYFSSKLVLAHWKHNGVQEEPGPRSCIIEATSGKVVFFVCDYGEVVLLKDVNSTFVVKPVADGVPVLAGMEDGTVQTQRQDTTSDSRLTTGATNGKLRLPNFRFLLVTIPVL